MKLSTSSVEVHHRGILVKKEYKVAQSAKVMSMFSDMVYSDKVKAPIRELSTNSWDAHIMAGNTKDVPVMKLPTRINPKFSLRDFGTGLSVDQLENMYRTYGESNKSDSNDYNGCMGIGSKSPFAYAPSFTTTSFYNGKKYIYVNAKDERGLPSLQKLFEGETSEPNGLEVSFLVKDSDFESFRSKAGAVLEWFPKPFKVEGGNISKNERKYSLEGKGWKIRSDTDRSCGVMGFVEYPIDKHHFSKKGADSNTADHWYRYNDKTPVIQLLGMGLELHFDMGEIDFDVSREKLQYNQMTIDAITTRLEQVLLDIREIMSEKFKNCKSLWDARCLRYDLSKGDLREIQGLIHLATPQWKGQDIDCTLDFDRKITGVKTVSFYKSRHRASATRSDSIYNIYANNEDKFYDYDVERGAYAACMREACKVEETTHYLLKFDDDKARQAFFDYTGMDKSKLISIAGLPKPPKGKAQLKENVWKFKSRDSGYFNTSYQKEWWDKDVVDIDDGGVFVEINNFRVRKEGGGEDFSNHLNSILFALKKLGIQAPVISGIKTSIVKKYRTSSLWVDFYKWAEDKVTAYIAREAISDKMAAIDLYKKFDTRKFEVLSRDTAPVLRQASLIIKILNEIRRLETINDLWAVKLQSVSKVIELLGMKLPESKNNQQLKALAKEAFTKFELLEVDTSTISRNSERFVRYINMMEGK